MKKAVAFIAFLICVLAVFAGCNVSQASREEVSEETSWVSVQESSTPAYVPKMLFEYKDGDYQEHDIEIPEFPNVKFHFSRNWRTCMMVDGKSIITRPMVMSIRDVYLADLNGDGLPEICVLGYEGSGMPSTAVIVYDVHNEEFYMHYPKRDPIWKFDIKDGKLVVIKQEYNKLDEEAPLTIVDGEIVVDVSPPRYFPHKSFAEMGEDFEISDFYEVNFHYGQTEITADGKPIMTGMPISDVHLADLNGDELPEICGISYMGNGMTITTVMVYDFRNKKEYDYSSGSHDFWWKLAIKDDKLVAVQTGMWENDKTIYSEGVLSIVDGKLIADGIEL